MKATLHLYEPQRAHRALMELWFDLKAHLMAGHRFELSIREERRTTAQNARLWLLLTDISKQVDWHGQKLAPEDWKVMATAALKRQRVVPGIEGGFVVLGESTSRMTKKEHAELQDFLEAFGAQHGVKFTVHEPVSA